MQERVAALGTAGGKRVLSPAVMATQLIVALMDSHVGVTAAARYYEAALVAN
jgi:hypothetical protein